ncbi:DUF6318 family protein [Jatrophihabitans sp. DSM 45814]
MRLNAGFVVAVVCVAVAVVGCGSGSRGGRSGPVVGSSAGSASAVGSGSSSPGVVASPGPTASVVTTGPNLLPGQTRPVPPAGLMEHTQRGAEATAVFFWVATDWGYATGDASVLRPVTAATCGACGSQLAIFADVSAQGGHFVGGHIAIDGYRDVDVVNARAHGEMAVDTTVTARPLRVVNQAGKDTESPTPTLHLTQRIYVRWGAQGWQVSETARVENR